MERDEKLRFKPLGDTTVRRLTNLAEEMAWQILPNLWEKLHSDLDHKEPLPEELKELLGERLRDEAFDFHVRIEVIKRNPQLQGTDRNFLQNIEDTPLIRRVYGVFVRQLETYRKKNKEDLSQTILKAKQGDTRAICKLLKWDKSFIKFDFIQNEFSSRQQRNREEDRVFFERVADAIRKKPDVKQNTKNEGLLSLIELYANRYNLSGDNKKHLKSLHTRLFEDGAFDLGTEEGGNPLADFEYFKKYLKRHYII